MRTKKWIYITKTQGLFVTAVFFCGFTAVLAQPGNLDNSFNTGKGPNGFVLTSALQSDGKIIIGGSFTSYNGTSRSRISRINVDGSLDTSFKPLKGVDGTVETTAVQRDKKIIIGGAFTSYNAALRNNIARINADGTIDTSFNLGTGADSFILTTSIQTDGKIIIGGGFSNYNGTPRNHIARLNPDGTLDATFDPGKGVDKDVFVTVLQADGKLIIGGNFKSYNGTLKNRIARINEDGSLDTSFESGTGTDDYVSTIALQPDGKIIIGGNFTSYNGMPRNRIARLNIDGTLDASFNSGTGANDIVGTIGFQSDGKLIIGGNFKSYNGIPVNNIVRINIDGTLDASFVTGKSVNKYVDNILIQPDDKLIMGGEFTSYNGNKSNYIARILLRKLKVKK